MAGFNQILTQAKQFWSGRTTNQRIFLGAGAAATVGLLALFTNLMIAPDYKPLINGLEPADAQTISADLTAKKIPFQLSPDGKSISVPADQLDAARLDVTANQSTHSGRLGFEIFDKVSWGQTEFDEKVNYQRALEGELERTIMTLGGVKSARVHLVMATDSVFLDRQRAAKVGEFVLVHHRRDGRGRHDLPGAVQLVTPALVYKLGDHAVDDGVCVGAVADVVQEVGDIFRRDIRTKRDIDITLRRIERVHVAVRSLGGDIGA